MIDSLYGDYRRFQNHFIYIVAVSAPIHAFLQFSQPFPKKQTLVSSKLKDFADDNLQL